MPGLGPSEGVEGIWYFDGASLVSGNTLNSERFVPTSSSLWRGCWWLAGTISDGTSCLAAFANLNIDGC